MSINVLASHVDASVGLAETFVRSLIWRDDSTSLSLAGKFGSKDVSKLATWFNEEFIDEFIEELIAELIDALIEGLREFKDEFNGGWTGGVKFWFKFKFNPDKEERLGRFGKLERFGSDVASWGLKEGVCRTVEAILWSAWASAGDRFIPGRKLE